MTDRQSKYDQLVVFDQTYQAVVAYAVSPLAAPVSRQSIDSGRINHLPRSLILAAVRRPYLTRFPAVRTLTPISLAASLTDK